METSSTNDAYVYLGLAGETGRRQVIQSGVYRMTDGSVVHGSDVSSKYPHPRSRSGNADVARASQLQHAVEDMHSYVNLSRTTFVQTRA
jgi:hypothetical protein